MTGGGHAVSHGGGGGTNLGRTSPLRAGSPVLSTTSLGSTGASTMLQRQPFQPLQAPQHAADLSKQAHAASQTGGGFRTSPALHATYVPKEMTADGTRVLAFSRHGARRLGV